MHSQNWIIASTHAVHRDVALKTRKRAFGHPNTHQTVRKSHSSISYGIEI
jgi:hypothetical protein